MTENEAIERLQTLNIILTDKAGHKEDGIEKIFTFSDITAICKAIQALEEIQQYRAIGLTPTMVKDLIKSCKKHEKNALENAHIVDDYQAIGTVEEFKALKEKSVAKKPILVIRGFLQFYPCPNPDCSNPTVYKQVFPKQKYCVYCGQKLDWNTDKEETVQTIGYADQSGLMSAT